MDKMKLILFALLLSGLSANTQEKIEWMDFNEAFKRSQAEPKKILVDVYTDWCGWCKVMDKNTFGHPQIIHYINENYYAVKLNAELKETITLGSKSYKYVKNGSRGYHELAAVLLNGKLSFPSVVFLDEKTGILYPLQGYVKPKQFDEIMRYYGEDHYQDKSWEDFLASYESPIKE